MPREALSTRIMPAASGAHECATVEYDATSDACGLSSQFTLLYSNFNRGYTRRWRRNGSVLTHGRHIAVRRRGGSGARHPRSKCVVDFEASYCVMSDASSMRNVV